MALDMRALVSVFIHEVVCLSVETITSPVCGASRRNVDMSQRCADNLKSLLAPSKGDLQCACFQCEAAGMRIRDGSPLEKSGLLS